MNPFDLLKNLDINNLKKKSEEMMEKIKGFDATGEAGAGFVKVIISGDFKIKDIIYEKNEYITGDIDMFKTLIIAAQNDACNKMKEMIQKELPTDFNPGLF